MKREFPAKVLTASEMLGRITVVLFGVVVLAVVCSRFVRLGPWNNPGLVVNLAAGALGGAVLGLYYEQRAGSGTRYVLSCDRLEVVCGKGAYTIAKSRIRSIVEYVSPFSVRGSVRIDAGGHSYFLGAENHTVFAESLEDVCGVAVQEVSVFKWLRGMSWRVAGRAMLVLCPYLLMGVLARLQEVRFAALGALIGVMSARGHLDNGWDPGGWRMRAWRGAIVPLCLVGLLAGRGLGWRRSVVKALDVSAIGGAVSEKIVIGDVGGGSFRVPAGWKVGRSSDGVSNWMVLRGETDAGEKLLAVVGWRAVAGELGTSYWIYERLAAEQVAEAKQQYRGGEGRMEFDFAGWDAESGLLHRFSHEPITARKGEAHTWWQASGGTVFTITLEKGEPGDAAVRAFLDSVEVANPLGKPDAAELGRYRTENAASPDNADNIDVQDLPPRSDGQR